MKTTQIGTKLVRSTGLVMALILFAGIGWNVYTQQKQARLELLEQSRVLAAQVLALRKVTADNQQKINYDSRGNFEFKHLNPAAVVHQMSGVFNTSTDYRIRQVSLKPRIPENRADQYEKEELLRFSRDTGTKESWGEMPINGENYFRYMVPLYVDRSCLSCHGGPKGERDISGNLKEGYKEGDLIGALAIAIPMKNKEASLARSMTQNIFFTALAIIFSAAVIIFHTNRFVSRPIAGLARFSQELGRGNLDAQPEGIAAYGELQELTQRFAQMASELKGIYGQLEQKVTERTRELAEANHELSKANNELSKANKYKSEFLANMSHELRTPLTAILAFTDDLLKESLGRLAPAQLEYLEDIRDSGQQLLTMINELLDLSKIDAGKMVLQLTEFDIQDVVVQVVKMLKPLALSKDIQVRVVSSESPDIIADREKIAQVVQNLLGNAIKFSPPGSRVEVIIGESLNDSLNDSSEDVKGIFITVNDAGPGIPKDHQEKIFEVFYQVNGGLNREYKGTGLGLALVRKMVNLHLGRVELVSEEGKGSTFKVWLPTYPPFDEELLDEESV